MDGVRRSEAKMEMAIINEEVLREYRRERMLRMKEREAVWKRKADIKRGRVIQQDGNTVLIVGEEKYIAKCEACDKYDAEKGLLICLIKALGLTTSDFMDLLSRAEVKKSSKKAKDVKCCKKGKTSGAQAKNIL